MGLRSEISSLEGDRKNLIENLRWFARNLNQEADYLEADADREPSTSMCTGSLPHDIDAMANKIIAKQRILQSVVGELIEQGVVIPGITIVKDQFNRARVHGAWER